MILRPRRRSGFTLLEILLATLIAALVLAALYLAMFVTLKQTQTSRDAVAVENLSRGLFNKISLDLSGTLSPLPPKTGGNSAASGGGTAPAATGGTGSTAPATGTGTTTGTTAATSATTDPATAGVTDTATVNTAAPQFQGGVYGLEKQLVIYAGRVPEAFGRFGNPGEQIRSDQRQIIYWLGPSGGLYRQVRPWVTATGLSNDPDPESPDAVLIAEEVSDVTFEYSDGSTWAVEWDGTALGPDGVTPLGPPRAIRVTLTLQIPTGNGSFVEKRMSQVIPVRSAPGTNTPTLIEAPTDGATDGGTTGSGTTGSGTTGGTSTGAATTGGSTGGSVTGGATGGSTMGATGGSSMTGAGTGGATGGTKTGGSMGAGTSGKGGGR